MPFIPFQKIEEFEGAINAYNFVKLKFRRYKYANEL